MKIHNNASMLAILFCIFLQLTSLEPKASSSITKDALFENLFATTDEVYALITDEVDDLVEICKICEGLCEIISHLYEKHQDLILTSCPFCKESTESMSSKEWTKHLCQESTSRFTCPVGEGTCFKSEKHFALLQSKRIIEDDDESDSDDNYSPSPTAKKPAKKNSLPSKKLVTCKSICPECNAQFSDYANMRRHVRTQHSENQRTTWPCRHPGCTKQFTAKANRDRHEKIHEYKKDFICTEPGCDFETHTKYHFDVHTKKHLLEKGLILPPARIFACSIPGCSSSFASAFTRDQHERSHRPGIIIMCPFLKCNAQFDSNGNYLAHKQEHIYPTNKDGRYVCLGDECGKTFPTKRSVDRHVRDIHKNTAIYTCHVPGCTSEFNSKSLLNSHIKRHGSKGTFPCDYPGCTSKLSTNAHLKRHKKDCHGI